MDANRKSTVEGVATTAPRAAWTQDLLQDPHHVPDKARRVQSMFNGIAPRYEFINSLFSFGRDAAWRRKAVRVAGITPDDLVLDIACGTGDFARAFHRAGPKRVVGCDFAHDMLRKAAEREDGPTAWCEADAQHLPFLDGSFTVTSCAFGVRNFQDLDRGLREMHRVLRPGGRAVILEFTEPRNRVMRFLNDLYSKRFMPTAASWISGDRLGAYRYLPKSVESFLTAEAMKARLLQAGFARVETRPMTMGIVTIYLGWRDEM
ncbi:MAG: bifunctional demethylmenaquinone methyltransferase/2-methoxy-6-polyprenyl-1,4-benzoquinol methylase UbiE [Phycisphaerae bacterium]